MLAGAPLLPGLLPAALVLGAGASGAAVLKEGPPPCARGRPATWGLRAAGHVHRPRPARPLAPHPQYQLAPVWQVPRVCMPAPRCTAAAGGRPPRAAARASSPRRGSAACQRVPAAARERGGRCWRRQWGGEACVCARRRRPQRAACEWAAPFAPAPLCACMLIPTVQCWACLHARCQARTARARHQAPPCHTPLCWSSATALPSPSSARTTPTSAARTGRSCSM